MFLPQKLHQVFGLLACMTPDALMSVTAFYEALVYYASLRVPGAVWKA